MADDMVLDAEQRRVAIGAFAALILTVAALTLGITGFFLVPLPQSLHDQLRLLASSSFAIILPLIYSVARLANHRFSTPADIVGAGFAGGTDRARMLQALLQNTLEQVVLAIVAYAAWIFFAPHGWGAMPLLACIMFIGGRIAFFHGYAKGAGGRAFGFGLTFYPTVGMKLLMLPFVAKSLWDSLFQ